MAKRKQKRTRPLGNNMEQVEAINITGIKKLFDKRSKKQDPVIQKTVVSQPTQAPIAPPLPSSEQLALVPRVKQKETKVVLPNAITPSKWMDPRIESHQGMINELKSKLKKRRTLTQSVC
eukprot:Protomagalhaensia_wolfi_Nauph_80__2816@NODE_2926_length_941_cov_10_351441_g2297_i0_p1_GENE_NODE_2926_length_941_cov_10_351441_g2297_i0NODE_2926_length_941_cov_10_351441_g2297_i0_p1_ORF_typecomplete_len136_score24_37_NODE_2926_length_941_cov_10_351441_g2297_i0533892